MKHKGKKIAMRLILKSLSLVMTSLNSTLGEKGPEFVHYVPTVIERSKSINIQYLRTAIHFSGQSLNITKS